MLFALIARDKPGAIETRRATRDAHLAYVERTGCVAQGGALLDEAGEMAGSLIILDVPDIDAARDWAAKDPYAEAGLFESVTIQPWKKVIG